MCETPQPPVRSEIRSPAPIPGERACGGLRAREVTSPSAAPHGPFTPGIFSGFVIFL